MTAWVAPVPGVRVQQQAPDIGSTYSFEIRSQHPWAPVEPVREAVRAYDPNLPVNEIRPLAVMSQ